MIMGHVEITRYSEDKRPDDIRVIVGGFDTEEIEVAHEHAIWKAINAIVKPVPDPMHAVLRDLFEYRWNPRPGDSLLMTPDDAIGALARKHGGDSPDLLAARIRAIVGGGE